MGKVNLVVTTIASPNDILKELAKKSIELNYDFVVVGDVKSPPDFKLQGADYYDIPRQESSGLDFAVHCPKKHYARKNIGYLLAFRNGASLIQETDDDNLPLKGFWQVRDRIQNVQTIENAGWVNVYKYVSDENIWPRGFALDALKNPLTPWEKLPKKKLDCPVHQGLANASPDVDAMYLLSAPGPVNFREDRRFVLTKGTWCPFNSQNTTWWPETFPLLYLPAYSTFRLTDIWRSYVAQRILWENDWSILFYEPTVVHLRNVHNLLADFAQEVPGYLNARKICDALGQLNLKKGVEYLTDNLYVCYEKFVSMELLDRKELDLLEHWIKDIKTIRQSSGYKEKQHK